MLPEDVLASPRLASRVNELCIERDALKEDIRIIKHDLKLTQDAHIEALGERDVLKAELEKSDWAKVQMEFARLENAADKISRDRDHWKSLAMKAKETLEYIYEHGKGVDEMTQWAKQALAMWPK